MATLDWSASVSLACVRTSSRPVCKRDACAPVRTRPQVSLSRQFRFFFRMAFGALKHRDVAEIDGMLEWFVGLVAELAFAFGERAQIDRMLARPQLRVFFRRARGVIDHRVANVTVVGNHLP